MFFVDSHLISCLFFNWRKRRTGNLFQPSHSERSKRTRNNPKLSTLLIGDIEAPQNSTYKIPVKWSYFENSDPYFPEKVSPTSKDSKGNWTENEEYVVRTITYY